jgi:hypothetical protein
VPYASEGEGLHLPPVPEALNRCVLRKQVPGAAAPSAPSSKQPQRSPLSTPECLRRLNYEERSMPNEGTAVMTGAQQRALAAHQPGQDVFESVLSEDINRKPFAAFPPFGPPRCHRGSALGGRTLHGQGPSAHGVKLIPHRHPEDRVDTVISGVSTSVWATSSMRKSWRHIRPEASSPCRAIRPISSGRNPVST